MCMCEQGGLHCTSQWGVDSTEWAVYCVAITFKMTEWVEQWICTKFPVKLEHSSAEAIRMIQKATVMGIWWLAASSWQCACSCIISHADIFGKTSNHPGASATSTAQIWCPTTSGFSQKYFTIALWVGYNYCLNFTYEITEVQRGYRANILKRLTEGILWSLTKSPFEVC